MSNRNTEITWRVELPVMADAHDMTTTPLSALNEAIGLRLRLARDLRKLTQEQLGELIGVGATTIQGWEKGRNTLDALALFRLIPVLGVSADFLIFDDIGSLRVEKATEIQALRRQYQQSPPPKRGPKPRSAAPISPLVRDVPDYASPITGANVHEKQAPLTRFGKTHA